MKLLSMAVPHYLDNLRSVHNSVGGKSTLSLSGALGSSLVYLYCSTALEQTCEHEELKGLLEIAREKADILCNDFEEFMSRNSPSSLEFYQETEDYSAEQSVNQEIYKEAVIVSFLNAQRGLELLRIVLALQYNGLLMSEQELKLAFHHAQTAIIGGLVLVDEDLQYIRDANFSQMIRKERDKIDRHSQDIISKINSYQEVTGHER